MSFAVNSNFDHHIASREGDVAKRLYINSVDYTQHVTRWPKISRDWNSVRPAVINLQMENNSQLFNFFHSDKTRLKDAVDIDYGVRYRSHNLLTQSNSFGASDWTKERAIVLTDQIANPINGAVDADKLFVGTQVDSTFKFDQSVSQRIETGQDYWASIYSRAAECLAFRFSIVHAGGIVRVDFDVESGTSIVTTNSVSMLQVLDSFIRQNTNGWYQTGVKVSVSSTVLVNPSFALMNPADKTDVIFTGNGSDGMYFYGAQLQEAQYAESKDYFMTGATRQEPWGMNLGKYTEQFSDASWGKTSAIFVTENTEVAPDGNTVADTIQNSNNSQEASISQETSLTDAEMEGADYWCASIYAKQGTAGDSRLLLGLHDVNSLTNRIGHQVFHDWGANTTSSSQFRFDVSSGMSFISAGSKEALDNGWVRLWCSVKKPEEFLHDPTRPYNEAKGLFYPGYSPHSGTAHVWGYKIEKGGEELLSGPTAYVAVHSDVQIYPSNAEDMINVFDGTITDANFGRGTLKLSAKDKFRELSERIVGTGEVPVDISSITPSWLAFTLCSCYGGMDNTQSTNNVDIDWASVDSWEAHNAGNSVHVAAKLRGIKITEALRRLSKMTRVATYIEDDLVTFKRFLNIDNTIISLGNSEIINATLSVHDQDLVNKQWVFADWDEASSFYKVALFDEDTASQNSFGLHEQVLKDKSIFYVSSPAALDTAQRIITNEAEPIDKLSLETLPGSIKMQLGESVSVSDPQLAIADTYRIMGYSIDMDRDRVNLKADNSQLLLADAFLLDTSSLGGTDVLS